MTTKRKRSDFASVKSASRKKIPSSKVLQMVLESSDGEHDVNMSCDNERDFTTETSEDEINSETTRELRVDVMDYQDAGDHRVKFHERRISMVMFTCRWAWPARWPIRPILGLWGSKILKHL